MKKSIWVTVCVVSLLASAAGAESTVDARWVGVWRAEMRGQPTAGTLTLAADTGELGGTVVLDMLTRQQREAAGDRHRAACAYQSPDKRQHIVVSREDEKA